MNLMSYISDVKKQAECREKRVLIRSLLNICTKKISTAGDFGDPLVATSEDGMPSALLQLLEEVKDGAIQVFVLQAIYSWQEMHPASSPFFVERGILQQLFAILGRVLTGSEDTSGMFSSSLVVKLLTGYMKRVDVSTIRTQIQDHNGVCMLLNICHCRLSTPRYVCIALHLLTQITKTCPTLLLEVLQNGGLSILATLLSRTESADIIKFAALAVSRWACNAEYGHLISTLEINNACWNLIMSADQMLFENVVYAYVVSAVCMLHIQTPDVLCQHILYTSPDTFKYFIKCVSCYETCFGKAGIVHHTLQAMLYGSYGAAFVHAAAVCQHLGILASQSMVLNAVFTVMESKESIQYLISNGDEKIEANIISFVLQNMAGDPERALRICLSYPGLRDSTKRALEHMSAQTYKPVMLSPTSCVHDEKGTLLTEYSWESSSATLEDAVFETKDSNNKKSMTEEHSSSKVYEHCATIFANMDPSMINLAVLSKLYVKILEQKGTDGRMHLKTLPEEPPSKKPRTDICASLSEDITINIGEQSFKMNRNLVIAHSSIIRLFLEDAHSEEGEIVLPQMLNLNEQEMVLAFKQVILWVESGTIQDNLGAEMIVKTWKFADFLLMDNLQAHLEGVLLKFLEADDTVFALICSMHEEYPTSFGIQRLIANYIIKTVAAISEQNEIQGLKAFSPFLGRNYDTIAIAVVDEFEKCFLKEMPY